MATEMTLKQGETINIFAGEMKILISRHTDSDDIHLYVDPKRPLFEVAIIPRTLKLFVLRAIQKVL